jgi:hypothetical protein
VIRFRFTIASMMAVVFVFGLSFASLRINSPLCANIVILTALIALCSAVLMAVAHAGPSRLAWVGCAVFGWPCFILGFGPVANDRLGPPPTAVLLEELIPYINPELDSVIKTDFSTARLGVIGYSEYGGNHAELRRYRQSTHAVLTLLFAALGFIIGHSLAARNDRASGAGQQQPVTDE